MGWIIYIHLQEPANNSQQDDEENDEEDDEEGGKDSDQPEPAIKTFKEAIASLEEVQHFLEKVNWRCLLKLGQY